MTPNKGPVPSDGASFGTYSTRNLRKSGRLQHLPWVSLSALFGTIVCAFAILGVLLSANGKPIDAWPNDKTPVQVAVVLAIIGAVGNATMLLAHREGVAVAWWLKMRRGGNLNDCHRYWEEGFNIWKSVKSLRNGSIISLATLILSLLLLVSPLFQRAAAVSTMSAIQRAEFSVALSSEFHWVTGYYMTRAPNINALDSGFVRVVQDFRQKTHIAVESTGCRGLCKGSFVAPGWDTKCSSTTVPYNLTHVGGAEYQVGAVQISFDGIRKNGMIEIETLYKPDTEQIGNLVRTNCILQIAKVGYDVELRDSIAVLPTRNSQVNDTIELQYPDNEMAGLGKFGSALGGIAFAAQEILGSNVTLYNTGIYAIESFGPMAWTYMTSGVEQLGGAGMTWADPTLDVLNSIRELTFRSAIAFSDPSNKQLVNGTEETLVVIYTLEKGYLAGGLVVNLLCVLVVVWLFKGCWFLDRKVTLSPVEIANAFDSPITRGADPNTEVDMLLEQIGGRTVKFGAFSSGNELGVSSQEENGLSQLNENEAPLGEVPATDSEVPMGEERGEGGNAVSQETIPAHSTPLAATPTPT